MRHICPPQQLPGFVVVQLNRRYRRVVARPQMYVLADFDVSLGRKRADQRRDEGAVADGEDVHHVDARGERGEGPCYRILPPLEYAHGECFPRLN